MANQDILDALVGMIADAVVERIGPQVSAKPSAGKSKGSTGRFSAEAIARMKASAKQRWARARAGEEKPAGAKKAAGGKSRRFSAEAIAKMRAAAKDRWARDRKG